MPDDDAGDEGLGWIPVSSSNVDAVRWAPAEPYPLQVQFRSGVYGYVAPYWMYEAILYAGSKGKAVNYFLKKTGVAYARLQ